MAKNIKELKSVVVDTNVLISSLIKDEGFTQAILSILLAQKEINILVPFTIKTELVAHISEISRKSGLPVKIVGELMSRFFKHVKIVREMEYAEEIRESLKLVTHEPDAPFAGLALKYAPSIILTYNKKHYNEKGLESGNVNVFTPSEFVKYLDMELKVGKKVKRKRGLLQLMSGLALLKRHSMK